MSEDPFTFLNKYGGLETVKFWDELKTIGVELKNMYLAKPYLGEKFNVEWQITLKEGLFTDRIILAGDNKTKLADIKDFVSYFPHYDRLKIKQKGTLIKKGYFELVLVTLMRDTHGKNKEIINIVKKWGGSKSTVDYILNDIEENLYGYIPSSDQNAAKALAELVETGANRPATNEEIQETQEMILKFAENLNKQGKK